MSALPPRRRGVQCGMTEPGVLATDLHSLFPFGLALGRAVRAFARSHRPCVGGIACLVYARQRSQCKRALLFRPGWRHNFGCGDHHGIPCRRETHTLTATRRQPPATLRKGSNSDDTQPRSLHTSAGSTSPPPAAARRATPTGAPISLAGKTALQTRVPRNDTP